VTDRTARPPQFRDVTRLETLMTDISRRHGPDADAVVEALVERLRSYWTRMQTGVRPSPFILGLSGGVDSTVVAFLATRAAGPDNVIAVTIRARADDDDAPVHAALARRWLGLDDRAAPTLIDVTAVVDRLIHVIDGQPHARWRLERDPSRRSDAERIRAGNLASRLRVSLFYDLASAYGGRVLGTSNRTEFLLGYAAKYGTPMSYDLGVLDDFYKTEVRRLAEAIDVPADILRRPSSTGYFAGQTHEDELGARYEELDAACYLLEDLRLPVEDAAAEFGVERGFLNSVSTRLAAAEHKRMLKPPSIDIMTRMER
jgi:NAD+ synthase